MNLNVNATFDVVIDREASERPGACHCMDTMQHHPHAGPIPDDDQVDVQGGVDVQVHVDVKVNAVN